MSTFGGRMLEYQLISIDRFDGVNLESTVYMLSHNHKGWCCNMHWMPARKYKILFDVFAFLEINIILFLMNMNLIILAYFKR